MSKTLVIKTGTTAQALPVGIVPGNYRYKLNDPAGLLVATHDDASPNYQFDNLAGGSVYALTIEQLDSNGNSISGISPYNTTVTVPPEVINANIPTSAEISFI